MTFDIETKLIEGKMEAICLSIYTGKGFKTFFVDDFKDNKEMLENAIKYLIRHKYNYSKIK